MANQYGIDMGAVINASEAGQNRAYKNKLMTQQQDEADANKLRAQEGRDLREKAKSGDQAAMRNLAAFDPQEADQMMAAITKMDEGQKKQLKDNIDQTGQIAHFVLSSKDPEQAYMKAIKFLPEGMRAQAPEKYDPQWMEVQLARATELDKLMENPEVMTMGGQDLMFQRGQQVGSTTSNALLRDQAKANAKASDGAGGGDKGPQSADESLMYRAVVQAVTGLDISNPDQASKFGTDFSQDARDTMLATAARATEIWKANPNMTRLQAAAQARRDAGGTVPDYSQKKGGADRENLLKRYLTPKQ